MTKIKMNQTGCNPACAYSYQRFLAHHQCSKRSWLADRLGPDCFKWQYYICITANLLVQPAMVIRISLFPCLVYFPITFFHTWHSMAPAQPTLPWWFCLHDILHASECFDDIKAFLLDISLVCNVYQIATYLPRWCKSALKQNLFKATSYNSEWGGFIWSAVVRSMVFLPFSTICTA